MICLSKRQLAKLEGHAKTAPRCPHCEKSLGDPFLPTARCVRQCPHCERSIVYVQHTVLVVEVESDRGTVREDPSDF